MKWLKEQFNRTVTSIAFLPAITALGFLLISWLMLEFDYSDTGKAIKAQWRWLRLQDAGTARNIISTIAAGVISLTVFSFSMVMIVLNQAASQLSNRVLDKLIGNRFQQAVLGFYIGTIVYALFLLSTIRDIDSGVHIPALSTYLLIAFTVLSIFLFIYFLHYITQSVKYETIIHRIYKQTKESLEKYCCHLNPPAETSYPLAGVEIKAPISGIFQGYDRKNLLNLCEQEDLIVSFIHPPETFVLQNTPLLMLLPANTLTQELENEVQAALQIDETETIVTNYFYGFRQLMEVAIKALSPGINDPGTAIISLHALADLLAYRAWHFPESSIKDAAGKVRIILKERTFDELITVCILPIWDYGKNDRLIRQALYQVLIQLPTYGHSRIIPKLLQAVRAAIGQNKL